MTVLGWLLAGMGHMHAPAAAAARARGAWPVCNVLQFGAKGDNRTKDTHALVAAVKACSGGGDVLLPAPGLYLTGAFNLTSNQRLVVEKGAMLVASQDLADYTEMPAFPSYGTPRDSVVPGSMCRYSAIVGGVGLSNVTVCGGGVLDGMGYAHTCLLYTSPSPRDA